jgi:hypothetical protein
VTPGLRVAPLRHFFSCGDRGEVAQTPREEVFGAEAPHLRRVRVHPGHVVTDGRTRPHIHQRNPRPPRQFGHLTGDAGNDAVTGSRLSGIGNVAGAITLNGGMIAPGNAANAGVLTTGTVPTFTSGAVVFNLTGGAPDSSQLKVATIGTLALGSAITLTVVPYTGASNPDHFTLISNTGGTVTGTFSGIPCSATGELTTPSATARSRGIPGAWSWPRCRSPRPSSFSGWRHWQRSAVAVP